MSVSDQPPNDRWDFGITPDQMVTYKHTYTDQNVPVELNLHVFLPPINESSASTLRSGMVFFFGGGWVKGDVRQFYRQAAYFASRGLVTFCAEYRIKTKHGTPASACVHDARSAMRWIKKHASQWQLDPDKIIAAGGSAGGHIAATAALTDRVLDDPNEEANSNPHTVALVLWNPVLDTSPGSDLTARIVDIWHSASPSIRSVHPCLQLLFSMEQRTA